MPNEKTVLLAIGGAMGLVAVGDIVKGKAPQPSRLLAVGVAGTITAAATDVAPALGKPMAALLIATLALTEVPPIAKALGVAEAKGWGTPQSDITPTDPNVGSSVGTGYLFDLPGGSAITSAGNSSGAAATGTSTKIVGIPALYTVTGNAKIAQKYLAETIRLCQQFQVKVLDGYSYAPSHVSNSDHHCGYAVDMVGSRKAMDSLSAYCVANHARYAISIYKEKGISRDGSTWRWSDHWDHVHISYERCSGKD